jgi:Transposase, Mutator family
VLSLYAKGLTTGEISAHFAEIYGASVSKETISRITDKVIEEMNDWSVRPLDEIYAAIFIDAIVTATRWWWSRRGEGDPGIRTGTATSSANLEPLFRCGRRNGPFGPAPPTPTRDKPGGRGSPRRTRDTASINPAPTGPSQ